jgi:putative transposase
MLFNRKNVRLSNANYAGRKAYFITICCDRRRSYLSSQTTADAIIAALNEVAAKHSFLLHAYCVMPDHIHFLAGGQDVDSDLLKFLNEFKSRTAYRFKKECNQRLWERSYHDHILRKNDAIESVASYIWSNPVRKGLCKHPQEFPFSGSLTMDWMSSAGVEHTFIPPWKPDRPV